MFPDSMTVREARQLHLKQNGFSVEQYTAPKVAITYLGRAFQFPNPKMRQREVPYHDLHHLVTGYGTDIRGEGEIAAWELVAGVNTPFLWAVNGVAALNGLFMAPIRTLRAAWSARGARALYLDRPEMDDILDCTLGELRARIGFRAYAAPEWVAERSSSSPRR